MTAYLSFNFLAPLGVDVLLLMTLALSLNLINGCAGMFSLGHQGFYGVGAYAAGAFVYYLGAPLGPLALPASILVGGLAAALFGLLVGIPCLRLKGDYLAIATLGFAEIFRVVVTQIDAVGASRGLRIDPPFLSRTLDQRFQFYVLFLAISAGLVVWTLVVIRNIMKSSHGRAIYAIREDEVAAELLGVNLTRYKVTVFAIGAGFAGLAGGVLVNFYLYITPVGFGLIFGVGLLLYVVLGGQGSLAGSMIAVVVIFGLEQLVLKTKFFGSLPPAADEWVGRYWQVVYALLLVAIVLVRPQGIFGKKSV